MNQNIIKPHISVQKAYFLHFGKLTIYAKRNRTMPHKTTKSMHFAIQKPFLKNTNAA